MKDYIKNNLPLATNKKLWAMAKVITERQKAAKESTTDKVDWDELMGEWFDWLKDELCGDDTNTPKHLRK